MDDLILHHYAGSPFAEKVRLILGFKALPWRSVTVPSVMPKPDLVALTGGYDHAVVLINDDQDLARAVGAQGLHLSSSRLWQIDQRPHFEWVAASCHTAADLLRAAALGLDFVVLGPVLPTASHTASTGMGWPAFTRLVERSPLPVYALGGLVLEMLEVARSSGAHGIALMRGWR